MSLYTGFETEVRMNLRTCSDSNMFWKYCGFLSSESDIPLKRNLQGFYLLRFFVKLQSRDRRILMRVNG